MQKLYKMMFFNSLIMGTLISICSYSWLSMWMGLEINLLSFIPLMTSKNNTSSTESSLKYFIVQALASTILLMSIILMLNLKEIMAPHMINFSIMLNSALFLKLGAAPFHFWFPEVMEGLNWSNCLILLTWQKIAPSILIMNNFQPMNFIILIIVSSSIIGSIMALNQISLRKILTFSSINHISWMTSTFMISKSIWTTYFLIYSTISIIIILSFKNLNLFYINQIPLILNNKKMLKFSFFSNFLSLGGLPPFLGFFPKWIVINFLIYNNLYLLSLILIMFSLIMLYSYIRLMFSTLLLNHNELKIQNTQTLSLTSNFINITGLMMCILTFNIL